MITIKTESYEITVDTELDETQVDRMVDIVTRESIKIIEAESRMAIEAATAGHLMGVNSETRN